jgi:hypothetical protein
MGNPKCFAFKGHGAWSATVCARLVSHLTSP